MKKHTICLEARPFAAFSDEQLDRLTARPDVEVLDCRGGAVDDPAFMGRLLINGMKTSGKKRDNLGSIGKSFRRGCNSIAESATKKEGNQPSFFVGG